MSSQSGQECKDITKTVLKVIYSFTFLCGLIVALLNVVYFFKFSAKLLNVNFIMGIILLIFSSYKLFINMKIWLEEIIYWWLFLSGRGYHSKVIKVTILIADSESYQILSLSSNYY